MYHFSHELDELVVHEVKMLLTKRKTSVKTDMLESELTYSLSIKDVFGAVGEMFFQVVLSWVFKDF